ncbi:hypothetical protein Tco_1491872 [Tanacetum coccineum]
MLSIGGGKPQDALAFEYLLMNRLTNTLISLDMAVDASYFDDVFCPNLLPMDKYKNKIGLKIDMHMSWINVPFYERKNTPGLTLKNAYLPCFLSQEEPKRVSKALSDPAWEVKQCKGTPSHFQAIKVMVLVDLPKGHRL